MKWTLEKRKLKDLKKLDNNPRRLSKHDGEHLQKSMDKFGQCEPVVINSDNTIIGGHQRAAVLKKMGEVEVDCYVPDFLMNDRDVKELSISLNRNAGEWDMDLLANTWDMPDLLEWGFTEKELFLDCEEEPEESPPVAEEKEKLCPKCGHDLNSEKK